jgi:hypothetical protein
MKLFIVLVFASLLTLSTFAKDKVLFSGLDLNAFDLRPGSWEIEKDGSVVCRMEKIKDKKGVERLKAWDSYGLKRNSAIFLFVLITNYPRVQTREFFIEVIRKTRFRKVLKSS